MHRASPAVRAWIKRNGGLRKGDRTTGPGSYRPAPALLTATSRAVPRRFPAPWTAERIPGGYVVKGATGRPRLCLCA